LLLDFYLWRLLDLAVLDMRKNIEDIENEIEKPKENIIEDMSDEGKWLIGLGAAFVFALLLGVTILMLPHSINSTSNITLNKSNESINTSINASTFYNQTNITENQMNQRIKNDSYCIAACYNKIKDYVCDSGMYEIGENNTCICNLVSCRVNYTNITAYPTFR